MELEDIFCYVKHTCWIDDTPNDIIVEIAKKYCDNLSPSFTKGKILHRLSGQSGCGKTTQLCYALEQIYIKKNKKPLIIGVRTFSPLHPNYDEILKEQGSNLIREKTNGFALKCLCAVLDILSERDYLIILDLTLLDPIFEKYITSLFKENYQVCYHIFAVNKSISDSFIEKRKNNLTGSEAGRITFNSSSQYFYEILSLGLEYLVKNQPDLNCVMWNIFDREPVYMGKISRSLEFFKANQNLIKPLTLAEEDMRQSKLIFYEKFLTDF